MSKFSTAGGRRPASFLSTISRGEMLNDAVMAKKTIKDDNPEEQWGLGVAKVLEVDYEEFYVTLQIITGSSGDMERIPVPLTFPGAGNRHFFGAMPEIGDVAIVDWMPQESNNTSQKTPVIVGWVIPGVWPGRNWHTTSNFTVEEADLGAKRDRDVITTSLPRIRHKLRHLQGGNIVGSSSQGSDLVLDESVTLSNRRGNELILRDQDQTLVARSLQQHHAMAGARIYAGMVQRDALSLSTTMVSDGKTWDGGTQAILGSIITEGQLPPDLATPDGFLKPARMLARARTEDGFLDRAALSVSESIDPYQFLQRGGFLDASGSVVDSRHRASAVYGGKPLYRVAQGSGKNAVLDPNARTLTEWRLEMAHTSDGRLPVTDQTDLFDAERLPKSIPESPGGRGENSPFIEMVLGSVIGNDPFTQKGRRSYGLPMVARVFNGSTVNPSIEPATLSAPGSSSGGTPIGEHAATLFRVTPISNDMPSSFVSWNKKGQLRAFVSGPQAETSVEVALQGGLKFSVGGSLDWSLDTGIAFKSQKGDRLTNVGVLFRSETGAVQIYGGGSLKGGEAQGERAAGKDGNVPSVDIEARTSMRLKAGKLVKIKGQSIEANADNLKLKGHETVEIKSAKKLAASAETVEFKVTGKRTDDFSGPKQNLPTNGPLHERTYSPTIPGQVCEKVTYNLGDREEEFTLGNHTTTIQVGDAVYETNAGSMTFRAVTSKIELSSSGIRETASVGNITLTATAGSLTATAATGVTLEATAGPAVLRSSVSVTLGAPILGPDQGPIICAGSLEPFSNLPYSTWGMGAKAHLIGGVGP